MWIEQVCVRIIVWDESPPLKKNERKNILANNGFINPMLKLLKSQVLWCAIPRLFSLHVGDFFKYDQTLKQHIGASFKYFLIIPKYVVPDMVNFCCLNLQTLSHTHQAQNSIFLNFGLLKNKHFCAGWVQMFCGGNIYRYHVKHISTS